ncbi:MAG: helix-turn-helix domain-containing protein [Clostridia bacterium]|nr:helix-turn-helix domain-containing protein [Clostridia bacterium]
MGIDLLTIFKNADLKEIGKTTANIISLAFKPNMKTGERMARAMLDDGRTLIKTITASGVVTETVHRIPEILSVAQRNEVIKDLAKKKLTQETIAAMLDISQSTVSNVLRKK